jgi:hypothetical protein
MGLSLPWLLLVFLRPSRLVQDVGKRSRLSSDAGYFCLALFVTEGRAW